jgi:hypothetical protein
VFNPLVAEFDTRAVEGTTDSPGVELGDKRALTMLRPPRRAPGHPDGVPPKDFKRQPLSATLEMPGVVEALAPHQFLRVCDELLQGHGGFPPGAVADRHGSLLRFAPADTPSPPADPPINHDPQMGSHAAPRRQ